ncbi:unnamed protein product, partial [Rotaria socialis]
TTPTTTTTTTKTTTVTTTATTPTTTACANAINYFEPITGHTCQTYIDYGFCNGTSIVSASHVNVPLAQEGCCACEASYPVSLPEEVKYLWISASDWFNNERLDQYIQW